MPIPRPTTSEAIAQVRQARRIAFGVPVEGPRRWLWRSMWPVAPRGGAWTVVVGVMAAVGLSILFLGSAGAIAVVAVPFVLLFVLLQNWSPMRKITRLRLRDLRTLRRGALANGLVVSTQPLPHKDRSGRRLSKIVVRYRAKGRFRRAEIAVGPSIRGTVKVGNKVAVLVDPKRPDRGIAPKLFGIGFVLPIAEDQRPEVLAQGAAPAALLSGAGPAMRFDLMAPFTDLKKAGRWSLRGPASIGSLSLEEGVLVQDFPKSNDRAEVDLAKPFVMLLSTWLLPDGQARLHVSVRSRGNKLKGDFVEFDVEVPQGWLSRRLALKEDYLPLVRLEDFVRLWSVLRGYAQGQGEDPGQKVSVMA